MSPQAREQPAAELGVGAMWADALKRRKRT
jgi:hypothetical protein